MIHIVGDINFSDGFFDTGFGIGRQIKKGLNPFKRLHFNTDDLWIGNLECVISRHSNKNRLQKKQFLIDPSYLSNIPHLDIYSVANNHVMQHGKAAYADMLKYIDSCGSQYVGSNDRRSIKFKHKDYSVGLVSFSQHDDRFTDTPDYWYQPEYSEIAREYANIAECDIRIAFVHWGCEFIDHPYFDQRQFARWLIDVGFNLVVGVHAHVLQGYETYKGGFIFFSLGNFVFNMPARNTRYSAVLHVDFHETIIINYDYVLINDENVPIILNEREVPEIYSFPFLNRKLESTTENEVYFKELFREVARYRRKNMRTICTSAFRYRTEDALEILWSFVKRRIL